ncbi:MAG: glycosyltransferase [Pseudomonadota bacterium]
MRVLHVIPNLGPGGPGRSLAVFAEESLALGRGIEHAVLVLARPLYMPLRLRLKRLGCRLLQGAGREETASAIRAADIVLIHFWNTPVLWDWLASGLPPARYVLWSKIEGSHPPQHLSEALIEAACGTVFTAPPPRHLVQEAAAVVPGLVEMQRVRGIERQAHHGFNADYLGTLTSGKLHPDFFAMLDRVEVPGLRVRLCGGALEPGFERALAATKRPERFEKLGFVEDIARVLATTDVLAYPLAPTTYASSDKSLQEAMLAGIPPVILPHGGPSRFVRDGETGIVAADEAAFAAAIERLYREPRLRSTLGQGARRYAEQAFAPRPHVERLLDTLHDARGREGAVFRLAHTTPSVRFLASQGWALDDARHALAGFLGGADTRLVDYASAAVDDLFQLEGGILQWRNAHPEDPVLRCWAGIWLTRTGDTEAAAAEFEVAADLGAPPVAIASAKERATCPPP